ncbi:MAG: hypothetical protein AAGG80_01805 [Pseudomonadota bacterium]
MAVEFFTRNLTYFTPEHLYHGVVLELFKDFPEITWLGDTEVLTSLGAYDDSNKPGWSDRLANSNHIKPHPRKRKYVELEKVLSAIILFTIIYDGRFEAYELFIKPQKELTHIALLEYKEFKRLSNLTRRITKDQFAKKQAVRAALIYYGLCRTQPVRDKALSHGIEIFEPDYLLEAIMQQTDEVIIDILPGYDTLLTTTQVLIKKITQISAMPFERIYYMQGNADLFAAFFDGLKSGELDMETIHFGFLIQMCRLAAKKAYISNLGSHTLQQGNFNIYWKILKLIEEVTYD